MFLNKKRKDNIVKEQKKNLDYLESCSINNHKMTEQFSCLLSPVNPSVKLQGKDDVAQIFTSVDI